MIDIDRKDYYEYGKPELADRTRLRLQTLINMGVSEVGTAEFGIPNVFSGLYIERVWNYPDADFEKYLQFIRETQAAYNAAVDKIESMKLAKSEVYVPEPQWDCWHCDTPNPVEGEFKELSPVHLRSQIATCKNCGHRSIVKETRRG